MGGRALGAVLLAVLALRGPHCHPLHQLGGLDPVGLAVAAPVNQHWLDELLGVLRHAGMCTPQAGQSMTTLSSPVLGQILTLNTDFIIINQFS